MFWQTSRFRIDLSRPLIMGIVNVTPDSFSDGGRHVDARAALLHCERLLKEGAHILDIGGESTRPGSPPVSLEQELARVLPVLRGAVTLGVPLSIDTYKPEVMRLALDLGVDILNDIWALRQDGAEDLVVQHPSCGVCLMHMHREPQTMHTTPMQGDVVPQVRDFLEGVTRKLRARGVAPDRIVLDAGIGFGKTVEQNFALLARQDELRELAYPWLAGWSRKSSLGSVTGVELAAERVVPSVAAALLAVEHGVAIVRVHDVKETVQALQVWNAMRAQKNKDINEQ
ncbi:dihydropteroate synthase [Hylemonella sp. W303a]|uniref:dihydropteroate synthase n=1 Tax=Hylemonella sp. W303a TaxID=3389873 RepID=UPI00396B48BD